MLVEPSLKQLPAQQQTGGRLLPHSNPLLVIAAILSVCWTVFAQPSSPASVHTDSSHSDGILSLFRLRGIGFVKLHAAGAEVSNG